MAEKKNISIKAEVWDFVKMLAVSLIAVALLTNFIIRPIRVDGDSMYPTLHDKSVGFSNILLMNLNGIQRFDVVIVWIEAHKEHLVKRVIGLPGDTVEYRSDVLYVNGEAMTEPFLDSDYKKSQTSTGFPHFTADMEPITLKEDEYFCMGDNRPYSSDSRRYGPFKRKDIKSKDVVVLYPFNLLEVVQ